MEGILPRTNESPIAETEGEEKVRGIVHGFTYPASSKGPSVGSSATKENWQEVLSSVQNHVALCQSRPCRFVLSGVCQYTLMDALFRLPLLDTVQGLIVALGHNLSCQLGIQFPFHFLLEKIQSSDLKLLLLLLLIFKWER